MLDSARTTDRLNRLQPERRVTLIEATWFVIHVTVFCGVLGTVGVNYNWWLAYLSATGAVSNMLAAEWLLGWWLDRRTARRREG